MKKRLMCLGWALLLTISAQALSAAPLLFDRQEYAARRSRLMDKIPDGIAVILGTTSPTGDREFRQGHDFAYFTGVEIPDAYLIIDGIRRESVLFFTIGEKEAEEEGLPAENTNEKWNALQKTMTLNLWDGRLTRELQFVRQLRDKFPPVDVRDCSALVWDLRKIKTPAEIEVLRRTARIGVKAHNALIQSTRPGVTFKQVGAAVEAMLKDKGMERFAQDFRGIVRYGGYNHMIGLATHDITETGYENLSLGVPRTVMDIEALKKNDGLLQIVGETRLKRGKK